MTERSLAHPTRTVRVDHAVLEEISELTGLEYRVLSSAFTGEQKDLALDVLKTATAEQKREGWEMAVRIEKIVATVLHEAHKRQTEEVMDMLSEGPESFYTRPSE